MPVKTKPIIECKNLTKRFEQKVVLDISELKIPRGKIVGLLGKNGAGKTTLIKLCNGLLTPSNGEVLIDGNEVGVDSKNDISYLPERTYLDRNMKIAETLKYFGDFYADFDLTRAMNLLQALELEPEMKISKMSKGMQEKLQLALVMSRRAKLYILDEPLGGIDPATRDYVLDLILENFDDGATMLISTHLIADVERILDEVIFIDHGKVILQQSADKLRSDHDASIDEIFRETFKSKEAK